MSIAETLKKHRLDEFRAVCEWIEKANTKELFLIVEEIRCCHDNLMVWNEKTKSLDKVESLTINDEYIQLNLEITKDK